MIVRRLQFRPNGSLEVIRDNPRYEKEVLSADEISDLKVLGKVVFRYGNIL
jgi:phage repressor protein C with HTH and peptisase S24 domain